MLNYNIEEIFPKEKFKGRLTMTDNNYWKYIYRSSNLIKRNLLFNHSIWIISAKFQQITILN